MRNLITDVPGVTVGNAHDARAAAGAARALRPVHALNDGDTVFAVSTGGGATGGEPPALTELGAATALPYATSLPDYRRRFAR